MPPNDLTPKRGRGRPRKTVVKDAPVVVRHMKFQEIKLAVPELPLALKAKKMYWHLRNIERHLEADPLFISPKEYFALLESMEKVYSQLREEKQGSHAQRKAARARVRAQSMAEDGDEIPTSRVGRPKSAGVDNGVPAIDPFGGKG